MDWKEFLKPTWRKAGYFLLFYFIIPLITFIAFLVIFGRPGVYGGVASISETLLMIPLSLIAPFWKLTWSPYLFPIILPLTIIYLLLIYLMACTIESDLEKKKKIACIILLIIGAVPLNLFITLAGFS